MRDGAPATQHHLPPKQAYLALFSLCVGFFMNLLDQSIVAVATPQIMDQLGAEYAAAIWVTSAYLLAYAVPLLVTGRLGGQFGQKRVYQVGMVIFTLSSLWCGLAEHHVAFGGSLPSRARANRSCAGSGAM